jgi:hypothetical protein
MFSSLRHQVFDSDDPGIANAHAGRILSKVPAKVEEFGRDQADIQICTALLRSMTRGCTRRHRSQFWLVIAEVNLEICWFRDETLTLTADKKRDTAGANFWRSGTLARHLLTGLP